MKKLIFLYLTLLTLVRIADMVYLLTRERTSIPLIVFIFIGILIVYGIGLIVKKYAKVLFIPDIRRFFLLNGIVTLFNILYVAITVPLIVSFSEIILMGSFLTVVIDICILYYCHRQLKNRYIPVDLTKNTKNHED